jgi:rubrerythrin
MNTEQLNELLVQSLEHERGGKLVYETALECVLNEELREEFGKYLEQTENHIRILEQLFEEFELDIDTMTPGREVVNSLGLALVEAMTLAKKAGDDAAAELVACECVVLAEVKDHLNWELLEECSTKVSGPKGRALKKAVEEVEDQEDVHLYHSKGWCRELWIKSLGMKAVLPPPEERRDVKTAIGAARAEQARTNMR